jgi:hypothetical protein
LPLNTVCYDLVSIIYGWKKHSFHLLPNFFHYQAKTSLCPLLPHLPNAQLFLPADTRLACLWISLTCKCLLVSSVLGLTR